jgi:hypothetical protein
MKTELHDRTSATTCWSAWSWNVFSDEATFHISGKANKHKSASGKHQNSQFSVEHKRDRKEVNEFCAVSQKKFDGPFSFMRKL